MTVKALMPVRTVNLVAPLAHKATDMHTPETAASAGVSPCDHLTPSSPLGYTPAVSSKKGLIGCRSPLARGAKPHPARYAAFHFLATSYGGPDGEAQASPVTLRVPRSPTPVRAAAQCRSWSAVVHKARLEINMAQIFEHPHAQFDRVIQTRIRGRLPKSVTSLYRVKQDRRIAEYKAQCLQDEIAKTLSIAIEWEQFGRDLRIKAETLKQKARSAKQ